MRRRQTLDLAFPDQINLTVSYGQPIQYLVTNQDGCNRRPCAQRSPIISTKPGHRSIEKLRRVQEKIEAQGMENVTVTQTDLFDTCLAEESFDAVLACNVLLYIKDRAAALARIRALLKPQGMLLLVSDCLGEGITRERMTKWFEYKTGKRPYVSFDTMRSLEREVANAGFSVLARENLFPAPPNLFLAARKE